MSEPTISKELSDILTWIAGHDAKCTERYNAIMHTFEQLSKVDAIQKLEIQAVEIRAEKNADDVSNLKQKIAFWAGLASAGGATVGTALTKLFGG